MTATLLMPKATAVWLIDNTALTFEQIADFCSLHVSEIQNIENGDVSGIMDASGDIIDVNPVKNTQLSKEEIAKAEADPKYRMKF